MNKILLLIVRGLCLLRFALNLPSYGDNSSDTDTDADYIFDEDTIRTYEIIINPEALAYLDEDPVKQEYVKVTIVLKERLSKMSEFGTRELRIFFSFPADRVCLDCDIDAVRDGTETVFGKKYATSSL